MNSQRVHRNSGRINRTLIALAIAGAVSTATAGEIDAFIRDQMKVRHVPALSVAVVRGGQVVMAKGYGEANVECASPASEDTVYQLASITKQFTATAVMMLVEDGRLALDDRIVERIDGLPDEWAGVTIRHLLNHTSGIRSFTAIPEISEHPSREYTRDGIVDLVRDSLLEFPPGGGWNYSNTGYFLLGMLIEETTGQTYEAFLRERIFNSLGMSSTKVDGPEEIVPRRADGYEWENGRLRNSPLVSPTQSFSAGSLISTVTDLARWDAALCGERLLSQSGLNAMWTPTVLEGNTVKDYGFGWTVGVHRTRRLVAHDGAIRGFSSYIVRFIDDKLTVILLMNLENGGAEHIANRIAEFHVPALAENAPKPVPDADPDTTRFLKRVTLQVAQGTGDPDWFTHKPREFFFPDRIKEGRDKLGVFGDLESFELMEDNTGGESTIRVYEAVFGTTIVHLTFTLTPDGRIAGIGIRRE